MKILIAAKKNIEPIICFALLVGFVCVSARLLPTMGRDEEAFAPDKRNNNGRGSHSFVRDARSSIAREEGIFKESLAKKPSTHFALLGRRSIFLRFPAFVPPEIKLPKKKIKKAEEGKEETVVVEEPKGPSLAWTGKVEMPGGVKVFIEDKATGELFIVQKGDKFGRIYTLREISGDEIVIACDGEEDILLKLEKR